MNRRQFLRNCSLLAAGTIAADQLDLVEKVKASASYFFQGGRPWYDFTINGLLDGKPIALRGCFDRPLAVGSPVIIPTLLNRFTIAVERHALPAIAAQFPDVPVPISISYHRQHAVELMPGDSIQLERPMFAL